MDKLELRRAFSTSVDEFNATELQKMDEALSPQQQQEWNSIYASFDGHSQLRGKVIGLEVIPIPEGALENGKTELTCFVVMQYLVKVLIPVPLFWMQDYQPVHPSSVVGAKVDYVIIGIERSGECAAASRIMALDQQRWYQREVKGLAEGDILPADILAVGPTRLLVTAGGYDVSMGQTSLSYNYLGDLREIYHVGQTMNTTVTKIDEDSIALSTKDIGPDPYTNAEIRHPVGSTRIGIITNKARGAVFCRLPDGCTVLCKYAHHFSDDQFHINDRVLIQIREFDDKHHWLRGRIASRIS